MNEDEQNKVLETEVLSDKNLEINENYVEGFDKQDVTNKQNSDNRDRRERTINIVHGNYNTVIRGDYIDNLKTQNNTELELDYKQDNRSVNINVKNLR